MGVIPRTNAPVPPYTSQSLRFPPAKKTALGRGEQTPDALLYYILIKLKFKNKTIMQIPKRTKHRKYQKGRCAGIQTNGTKLQFGKYGLKALDATRISAQTIEAVRRVITRQFKRNGVLWIRVFPDIPVTSKPAAMRMGKGKGNPFLWICRVQSGQILYEMDGVPYALARQAAHLARYKLNCRTAFVSENKIDQ